MFYVEVKVEALLFDDVMLHCLLTRYGQRTCNSYRLMEISFMHLYVSFTFFYHCICALVHLYSSIKWPNCMGVTACAVADMDGMRRMIIKKKYIQKQYKNNNNVAHEQNAKSRK